MKWIPLVVACLGVACPAFGQVSWTFGKTDYATGAGSACLTTGDVDGDGDVDVIYGRASDGQILLRFNQGNGQLGPAVGLAVLGGASSMAMGHLDSNGLLDLVITSEAQDSMAVLLGVGPGTFAAQPVLALPGKPVDVKLADLNGDGLDELVFADGAGPRILAGHYLGPSLPVTWQASALHEAPTNFAVGDLNGDGQPDIVASGVDAGNGSILLGKVGLDFRPPSYFPSAWGGGPIWMELGDFDGDGNLDAVSTEDDWFDSDIVIWKGNGDGTFGGQLWNTLTGSHRGLSATGDFNGDGDLDLVSSVWSSGLAGLVGTSAVTMWPVPQTAIGPGAVALERADMDQDGVQDLVLLDAQLGTLSVLLSMPETVTSHLNQMSVLSGAPKKHYMSLQLGRTYAGAPYLVLGSITGTAPGVGLGLVHIGLNPDAYTTLLFTKPNTLIKDSLGVLDANGAVNVVLSAGAAPLSPGLVGLTVNHAFLVLSPVTLGVTWASESMALLLQ